MPAYARPGLPRRVLRRRGRAHHRDRPADRRDAAASCDAIDIFPAKHFVTPAGQADRGAPATSRPSWRSSSSCFDEQGKLLEAQRLEQRTRYDLEMLREVGYCSGIENYSPPLWRCASPARAPWTLLDYFPDDFLLFIDESHMTHAAGARHVQRRPGAQGGAGRLRLPPAQRAGQPPADASRSSRSTLNQVIYTTRHARPLRAGALARRWWSRSSARPAWSIPQVEIRPTKGQIDDLVGEIRKRVEPRASARW